jgi:hypothetical protein
MLQTEDCGTYPHLALDPLDEVPEIATKASFWRPVLPGGAARCLGRCLAVVDVFGEFQDGSGERLGGLLRDQVPDSLQSYRGDLACGYLVEGLLGERGR